MVTVSIFYLQSTYGEAAYLQRKSYLVRKLEVVSNNCLTLDCAANSLANENLILESDEDAFGVPRLYFRDKRSFVSGFGTTVFRGSIAVESGKLTFELRSETTAL